MKTEIKIPWQGVALGLINIVMLILVIATMVFGSLAFLQAFIISQKQELAAIYLGTFSKGLISSYLVVIVETLLILGYFYGKKIAIITGLLISIVQLMATIVGAVLYFDQILYRLAGIFFLAGIIWLLISCLKHPFYGGDGRLSSKFWKKNGLLAVKT